MNNRDLQIATQKLSGETMVTLYTIDASSLGAGILRVTNMSDNGGLVTFGGIQFSPIPIKSEGWEMTTTGSLPRPKITVATLNPLIGSLVRQYNNGVGAIVYRQRTYARFLDGHETPDPTAQYATDVYRIDRKTDETAGYVEWELASPFDVEGIKIPFRQMFRDTCTHTYRRWDGVKFVYDKVTCPYTGDKFFKADGSSTQDASEDRCGKKLSDCKLRFGENGPLPTRSFPGIARIRA